MSDGLLKRAQVLKKRQEEANTAAIRAEEAAKAARARAEECRGTIKEEFDKSPKELVTWVATEKAAVEADIAELEAAVAALDGGTDE